MIQHPHTPRLLATLLTFCVLAFSACKDKDPEPPKREYKGGLLLLNEGNFQWGNASLDYIDPSGKITSDIFPILTGRPLGDVAQSIHLINNTVWIVVNNSGKLEALTLPTLEPSCTPTGFTSPRSIIPLSGGRTYVTDLYSRQITILDRQSCTITSSIHTGPWTESIISAEGKVWVTQSGTDKVLIIDPTTDRLTDSLLVGREPTSIVQASNGKLYVLCTGSLGPEYGQLSIVDPLTRTVVQSYTFPSPSDFPTQLALNPTADTLYWLNGGLFRMSIIDASLPIQPFIPANGMNFYSLTIHPTTGTIYLTDAKDYLQRGTLLQYTPSGTEISRHTTGIIPSDILFLP